MPRSSPRTPWSRSRLPTCFRAAPFCLPTLQGSRRGVRSGIRLKSSCCSEPSMPRLTKWRDGARYSRCVTTPPDHLRSPLVRLLTHSCHRLKPSAIRTLPSRVSPTHSPTMRGSWLSSPSTAETRCAKSRASSRGRSVRKRETWTCDSACTPVPLPPGFSLESAPVSSSLGIQVCAHAANASEFTRCRLIDRLPISQHGLQNGEHGNAELYSAF